MILNKKTKITINSSNINHYSKYYDDIYVSDVIEVDVENLTKSSSALLDLKCDSCGVEKQIKHKNYIQYGYKGGEWLCKSCKTKKNNLEKWGVENVFQLESVKEKTKKTVKEKWGVEYISQNEEVKKKINRDYKKENQKRKETVLKKWGVENVSQCESIKEKRKNTIKEKTGRRNT